MKLKNWLLRKLAEKEIIEWGNEYLTDDEKADYEAQQEEFRKLEAGEEIEPPWVKYSATITSYELRHNYWFNRVWRVFWRKLSADERAIYKQKWAMPDDWDMFCVEVENKKTELQQD